MADITSFMGENRFLSNFWPCQVRYGGHVFATVENAYQAAKCKDKTEIEKFIPLTPGDAKKMGETVALRDDWHEARIPVMRDLLSQKFQDADLKKQLLATGDAQLIEGNTWNDRFWGVCDGEGQNNLGKLLMELRGTL